MSEIVAIVAVLAAMGGAVFSTLQGYANRPEGDNYSLRKLAGGLIGSIFMSFAVINLVQLPETLSSIGYVGVIVINLLAGFGIDKALSSSKK